MTTISFTVPSEPVAFARAGSNGTRRFTPPKQTAWKATCGFLASTAMRGRALLTGPLHLDIVAVFAFPERWSPARRAATTWHTARVDGDNIGKIVGDSLNTIVFADDAIVARWTIEKLYGAEPHVLVTVTPLDAQSSPLEA